MIHLMLGTPIVVALWSAAQLPPALGAIMGALLTLSLIPWI